MKILANKEWFIDGCFHRVFYSVSLVFVNNMHFVISTRRISNTDYYNNITTSDPMSYDDAYKEYLKNEGDDIETLD